MAKRGGPKMVAVRRTKKAAPKKVTARKAVKKAAPKKVTARKAVKKAAPKGASARRPVRIAAAKEFSLEGRPSPEDITATLRNALTNIDLNELRHIGSDLSESLTGFTDFLELADREPTPTWDDPGSFVATRSTYFQLVRLLREYELEQNSGQFAPFLPAGIWPSPWERLVLPAVALRTLESESAGDWVGFGLPELSNWPGSRIENGWKILQGSIGDDSPNPGKGRRFRWVGAWVKVASGGLGVVADIGGAAIATAVGGPVGFAAAAVPAAGSIIAGGRTASKGLRELGDVADEIQLA